MSVSSANRVRIVAATFLLFCASLLLTAYSAKNPAIAQVGTRLVSDVLSPLEFVTHRLYSSVGSVWSNYISLWSLREEHERLRQRLLSLEEHNSRLLEVEHENQRLREILSFAQASALTGVAADVIGYDPSNWVKAVTISRAAGVNLTPGMPVIEGKGLVGQISSVASGSARVLLIIDSGSGVDATLQGERVRGVVSGNGSGGCEMHYVLNDAEVAVGERVITSGLDGVYPKGLLIGVVVEVSEKSNGMFRKIQVKPAVDFDKLESVLVVTKAGVMSSAQSKDVK